MIGRLAPNQKAIRVIKAQADKHNKYGVYNREAMMKAMRTLRPSAFKLWCYFGINQNKYEFGLSSAAVKEECGISVDSCQDGIKELIEKGYLIKVELYPKLEGYLFLENGRQS